MKKVLVGLILFTAIIGLGTWSQAENTPMGAEEAGNTAGDIPAFTGLKGLQCPANAAKGDYLPNPFKGDPILFKIDASNVDKYKDKLSAGQIARLKKNKNYHLNVYRSVRLMDFPEKYKQATEKNIKTAKLDEKNVLRGYNGGLPFPAPKNGTEAIWNVKKPWAGDDLYTNDCRRVVSPTGKVRRTAWTTKIIVFDESRIMLPKLPNPENVAMKILSFYSFPADRAGEGSLMVSFIDDNKDMDIWSYIPSLRRVRRAPNLQGGMQLDGESTMDEIGFDYRGPVNDWDWKLLGKKEMYVPYNNYDMWQINVPDSKECLSGDLNPDIVRYELHRVWGIEGTKKKDISHPYSRRITYYDEDSWAPLVQERYDARGNLWRMGEYYQTFDYCERVRAVTGYFYLNLESGRYEIVGGCRTKTTKTNATNINLKPDDFTVQAMRNAGH